MFPRVGKREGRERGDGDGAFYPRDRQAPAGRSAASRPTRGRGIRGHREELPAPGAFSSEKASRRQERVARRVVEEVTKRLAEVDDRNLGFVTVTGCDASPDLRHARVGVSILGDDARQAAGLLIVQRLLRRWRGEIGRALGTRVIPELRADLDSSLERTDRIGRLIRDARASDPNPGALSDDEAAALAAESGSGLSPAVARLAARAPDGSGGRFLADGDFADGDEIMDSLEQYSDTAFDDEDDEKDFDEEEDDFDDDEDFEDDDDEDFDADEDDDDEDLEDDDDEDDDGDFDDDDGDDEEEDG